MSDFDVDPFEEADRRIDDAAEQMKKEGRDPAPESVDEAKRIAHEAIEARYHSDPSGGVDPVLLDPETQAEADELLEPENVAVETPTPEEIASLPLTTAAALMPPVEEELPPPPGAEPPPDGETHGAFILQKRPGYGDGWRELVRVEDSGETTYVPVGVWLERDYPRLTGEQVGEMLVTMGLPEPRAEKYATARANVRNESTLPPDIAEVWGNTPKDVNTATSLIAAWGEEAFRGSALHKAALAERTHIEVKDSFSRAFVEAQKRKGKR